MAERLYEDAARFIRQRLIALEDGRDEDADLLEQFILDEFGVSLHDVAVEDVPEDLVDRWRKVYGLPEAVEFVTMMMNHAREPVWRIPVDRETRAVSWMETPIHLCPKDDPFAPEPDWDRVPKHLRPRQAGDLPPEVEAALRLS